MRTILLSLLLLLSVASPAQNNKGKKERTRTYTWESNADWKWGFEGGVDISRFRAQDGFFSDSNRCGWFLGVKNKFNIPLPNLGLDASFLYNQNKMNYGTRESKKLHQFVLPVNVRYNYKLGDKVVWYMASGPQWNWFLGNSSVAGGTLRHSYFDWNVGTGFDLFSHLQIGFNYNIALGKMGNVNGCDVKANSWNIRLGYYL